MTALNKQALRSKARSASAGEWIKESGDGWEAICSADDQANGNFIIAHFEGPDAKANREFAQVANPDTVLSLLDELEAAEKRIAEHRKVLNSLAAVARRYLPDYDEHPEIQAADELLESAAGIGVKGE
ncbi:ead/Ea22-like family protein [Escherichia coli]|uniref:ead/Ea22-like family protein n=1 Tax=Escherichia coli TaxID=562 RepID=UPI000DD8F5A9|nr:ead/Ea22-like family protein [Escherichia coli]